MKYLLAIAIAATMPLKALEPAAAALNDAMRAMAGSTKEVAQNVAFPYVYVRSTIAVTDEGETVVAYWMPGQGIIGHLPYPQPGDRRLLEIRTNTPPEQPFTAILRIYSDGTREVVPVERAKQQQGEVPQ
jgi:hypothetical protein